MDERLLALADVINSATAPGGDQAVLKYRLRSGRSSPLPPGKKLLPYMKITRNYERTWQRADKEMRKERRISNKLNRQDSKFLVEHLRHKASVQRLSTEAQSRTDGKPDSHGDFVTQLSTASDHLVEHSTIRKAFRSKDVQLQRQVSIESHITDKLGMKTISIQTELQENPLIAIGKGSNQKPKKVKTKARSLQVVMSNSHLNLSALRQLDASNEPKKMKTSTSMPDVRNNKSQKKTKKLQNIRRITSESSIDQLARQKTKGKQGTYVKVGASSSSSPDKRDVKRGSTGVMVADHKRKRHRGHQASPSTTRTDRETRNSQIQKHISKEKSPDKGPILLHQGRVHKPNYSPNIDKKREKDLYNSKEGKLREKLDGQEGKKRDVRAAAQERPWEQAEKEKKIRQRKETSTIQAAATKVDDANKLKKKAISGEERAKDVEKQAPPLIEKTPVQPMEITVKERLGKDDEDEPIIVEKTTPKANTDDLKPPGDAKLEAYEKLFIDKGPDEQAPADIDPELVAKVEEQIFEKIKFYKEVSGE
ncbi:caldesmon-like [Watersipora subatra]|uniref:caldesmon-like n=1 Tax=Watersipora subatra TaxID=2589382 RepID=UPI00355B88DA